MSFIVRFYLLYIILDKYQILKDTLLDKILWEAIPIATTLWAISYGVTGVVIQRWDVGISSVRAIVYFVTYLVLLGVLHAILWLLTKFGILPII